MESSLPQPNEDATAYAVSMVYGWVCHSRSYCHTNFLTKLDMSVFVCYPYKDDTHRYKLHTPYFSSTGVF